MKKNEICGICRKYIYTNKDSFCHLIDFKNGQWFCEGFYHTSCWHEKFDYQKKMKEKIHNLMGSASKLLVRAGVTEEPKQIYEVG